MRKSGGCWPGAADRPKAKTSSNTAIASAACFPILCIIAEIPGFIRFNRHVDSDSETGPSKHHHSLWALPESSPTRKVLRTFW